MSHLGEVPAHALGVGFDQLLECLISSLPFRNTSISPGRGSL